MPSQQEIIFANDINVTSTKPLELSFSAIETFNTCPRKYYYNYVLKLPKKTWPWLVLGTFVHLALEKFHKYVMYFKKRNMKFEYRHLMKRAYLSAARVYNRQKSNSNFNLTDKQIEQSKEILSNYLNKVIKNFPETYSVEKGFRLKIGEYVIRGFIDRIDKISDRVYEVVDYKTSSKAYEVDKNHQVALYAYALKKMLNEPDLQIKTKLDFIKLKKEKVGTYKDNQGALVEKYIKEAGDKIIFAKQNFKDEEQWQYKENDFCKFCDFKDRCFSQRGLFS